MMTTYISVLKHCCILAGTACASLATAMPNPAAVFCSALGHNIQGEACVFQDGSACDQWAFWRGECGIKYHICTQRGGAIVEHQNTPSCLIDQQYFQWTLKRASHQAERTWTVELVPFNSDSTAKPTSS